MIIQVPEIKLTKKVCLLSDHHISVNPRVWKEAFFYEKRGFEVRVITMWHSAFFLEKDLEILKGHSIKYECFLNLINGKINPVLRLFYRGRKSFAHLLQRSFNISTKWAISYAPENLYKAAMKAGADLYSAHLECAFYVGRKLVKAGKKVTFDFEDWYSHDYLVPERPVELLSSLEKFALERAAFCTVPSNAVALALQDFFKTKKHLPVIYNSFPNRFVNTRPKLTTKEHLKVLWFSRTIGTERGLEYLFKALPHCTVAVELHLLGNVTSDYEEQLKETFRQFNGHRLVLHPFISPHQLSSFISTFDVGLAIEENINDNKRLTVSNKILEYLQAGIHVIASDTLGQREVAAVVPSSVSIVDITDKSLFAKTIDCIFNKSKTDSLRMSEQERLAFDEKFSWQTQETKLNQLVESVL